LEDCVRLECEYHDLFHSGSFYCFKKNQKDQNRGGGGGGDGVDDGVDDGDDDRHDGDGDGGGHHDGDGDQIALLSYHDNHHHNLLIHRGVHHGHDDSHHHHHHHHHHRDQTHLHNLREQFQIFVKLLNVRRRVNKLHLITLAIQLTAEIYCS